MPEPSKPLYLRRADGRLERICEHGTGHTVAIDRVRYVDWNDPPSVEAWWSHGCCGCCADYERFGRTEA